ncbi:MAG: hypothetical protein RIB98_09840 [Acidimicrobiales bacterium]
MLLRGARAVAGHPPLWGTALVEFRRMLPDDWWRRPPFLPVPDAAMLAFRATTQYGDGSRAPEPHDLVAWLRWCKAENRRDRIR